MIPPAKKPFHQPYSFFIEGPVGDERPRSSWRFLLPS